MNSVSGSPVSTNFKFIFAFQSVDQFLVEIKNLDIPSDQPKETRLHWLRISKHDLHVQKLDFAEMGEAFRRFRQGRLDLSENEVKFFSEEGQVTQFALLEHPQSEAALNGTIQVFLSHLNNV